MQGEQLASLRVSTSFSICETASYFVDTFFYGFLFDGFASTLDEFQFPDDRRCSILVEQCSLWAARAEWVNRDASCMVGGGITHIQCYGLL